VSSLTKQQQTTLIYIAGCVLSLALGIGLLYSLTGIRKTVTKLKQDVEAKEQQAGGAKLQSPEEQSQWAEEQDRLNNLLLSDQAESQFMAEITRVASESGIQRLGMSSEGNSSDAGKTQEDAKILALGVHRYLTVTLRFQGQYADVARFLGGVSKLQRAVEFHLVDMKRAFPLIEVQVVMNVYKKEPA
jgi:Tfp pilus assembly protein PilO